MLVSQSEKSPFLKALGKASQTPEFWGVDVLARAGKRWTGFQRKAIPDLVASLYDGRISQERAQWNGLLDIGGRIVLVIEGKFRWSSEGELLGLHGKPWTRRDFNRFIYSVGKQGVIVAYTDDQQHTAELIEDWVAYEEEKRSGSRLASRPSPRGRWGKADSREWQVWVLTSLGPTIGAGIAEKILDAFDGRIPMQWTVEYEDLLKVPGVGKKRADILWRALNPLSAVPEPKEQQKRVGGHRGKRTKTSST